MNDLRERRRILSVVGARPNIMKLSSVHHALRGRPEIDHVVVHTGQHYDPALSDVFFSEFDLPRPDVNLEIGSAPHGRQTGLILARMEETFETERPDIVVVYGDVNSTMAAALAAVKMGIPVAHVEAGLRSHDRSMPEEINRVLTDRVADLLFAPDREAVEELRREGIVRGVSLVGNTMFDTLARMQARLESDPEARAFAERHGPYAVASLHRPSNVDDPSALRAALVALNDLSRSIPVLFPVHPRTARRIREAGLEPLLESARVIPREPAGYVTFLSLVSRSVGVVTDSGGLQEETSFLGVPCLTLRAGTERPWTVTRGTNRIVPDPRDVPAAWREIMDPSRRESFKSYRDEFTDGRVGERIADEIAGPR